MTAADDRPGSRDEDRDDRDAIDRAFADLVAGYHLTAERPKPTAGSAPEAVESAAEEEPTTQRTVGRADDHSLFRFEPGPEPAPRPEPEAEPEDRYVPPPPDPLPKPAWPVLAAWIGMGYAVLMLLAVVVGIRLPTWAGWLAIIGFVGGFGIIVTRLPRERPPDAGDGAVL